MRKHKKIIFIVLAAVLAVGATLGIAAVASANDSGAVRAQSCNLSMFEKICTIYKANTGTTIDAAELNKAFTQARQEAATEARQALEERMAKSLDEMLKKMVDDGKITQQQADDYQKWLAARPDNVLSNEYKEWLKTKPEGIPLGPGMRGPAVERGIKRMGNMFRDFCAPDNTK
jgi:flagellar hook-basal body complex protein FliE